jgi:hypothetical protein
MSVIDVLCKCVVYAADAIGQETLPGMILYTSAKYKCYLPKPSSNEYLRCGCAHPVETAEIITLKSHTPYIHMLFFCFQYVTSSLLCFY